MAIANSDIVIRWFAEYFFIFFFFSSYYTEILTSLKDVYVQRWYNWEKKKIKTSLFNILISNVIRHTRMNN